MAIAIEYGNQNFGQSNPYLWYPDRQQGSFIGGKSVTTPDEFRNAAFGPIDQPVEILIVRADTELTQSASRTPFEKQQASAK